MISYNQQIFDCPNEIHDLIRLNNYKNNQKLISIEYDFDFNYYINNLFSTWRLNNN